MGPFVRSTAMLDHPMLIAWLAQNAALTASPKGGGRALHPKLVPVPIGLQNQQVGRSGALGRLEPYLRCASIYLENRCIPKHGHFLCRKAPPVYQPGSREGDQRRRPILVYVNFTPFHHPLRMRALETFKGLATVQERDRDRLEDFWDKVVASKFVLSPPGNPGWILSAAQTD